MADTIASPILRSMLDKLVSIVRLPRDLMMLSGSIAALLPSIIEVEEMLIAENDFALIFLFTRVKDATYEADLIIDRLLLLLSSSTTSNFNEVSRFFSISRNQIKLLTKKMKSQLKEIREMLDEMRLALGASRERLRAKRKTRTLPFIIETEIYGRTDDKEKIVHMLLSDSWYEKSEVISIVGMGGIGKTTLAQLVFNDQRVRTHFELKAWVHVTEDFDERIIAKEIIEDVTRTNCDFLDMNLLSHRLLELFGFRRSLIVLDDVWNVDPEIWNLLKHLLSRKSCKFIVTSRNEKVARMMGSDHIHHLEALSEDDCWSLFRNQADEFWQCEERALVEIGMEIAKKCKGLPLAIKVIGGRLFDKRQESKWLFTKDEGIFILPEYEADVLPILKLSYYHLPSHLKQCFAYCSIFPKGYNINREKLIQLWMAEGFIESSRGVKMLEDIGNDYFMELLWNSFFEVVNEDAYGNIMECKMNDFIQDLACSVARIGCSIVVDGSAETISESIRYSSLLSEFTLPAIPESLHKAKNLRTLLLISATKAFTKGPFLSFRCLRVLDLSQTGIVKLPVSIGALKHLRYLDLSHSSIETLPESITGLKNLQTLKLVKCCHFLELPKDLKRMINLRHLDFSLCCSLSHLPSGIGQLTCLQTLPVFMVAKKNQCNLRELRRLNLGGKLEIKNLEYVKSDIEACEAELKEKQNLQSLGLSWGDDMDPNLGRFGDSVLECLQPHGNLKELSITGYRGVFFPTWMILLENLVKISMTNCRGCLYLPALGRLPNLKALYLKGMDALTHIGPEFYGTGAVRGFPSLNVLEIYNMANLESWLSLIEVEESSSLIVPKAFPHLYTLIVERCPKLTSLPLLPVLKDLALWNNREILLCSLAKLTSLSTLVINDFRELLYLPVELGNLNSIKKLTIYDCKSLFSLLDEGVPGLTSLQHLSILFCNKLKFLSRGLTYLISLEELIIDGCPDLVSLPYGMQHMISLRKLIIRGCPKLMFFPMGFELNTALQFLFIYECLELERQLRKGGECWAIITHIPLIEINGCIINPSSMELEREGGRQGEVSPSPSGF